MSNSEHNTVLSVDGNTVLSVFLSHQQTTPQGDEMDQDNLVMFNGQLCDKKLALMVIEKVLPTVLEVCAEAIKDRRSEEEVISAAKTVVNAAVAAISLKSLASPKC